MKPSDQYLAVAFAFIVAANALIDVSWVATLVSLLAGVLYGVRAVMEWR